MMELKNPMLDFRPWNKIMKYYLKNLPVNPRAPEKTHRCLRRWSNLKAAMLIFPDVLNWYMMKHMLMLILPVIEMKAIQMLIFILEDPYTGDNKLLVTFC